MTIKVTVQCAWCQDKEETSLETPVPKGWSTTDVLDPNWPITRAKIEENFCSQEHQDLYEENAPKAHAAAAKDYTAKFYAEMNTLRSAPSNNDS